MARIFRSDKPLNSSARLHLTVSRQALSVVLGSLVSCASMIDPAHAQTVPGAIEPLQVAPDPSGLDILNGQIERGGPTLSIPASPRLTFRRGSDWYINVSGSFNLTSSTGSFTVNYKGPKSIAFSCEGPCRDVLELDMQNTNSSYFNPWTLDFSPAETAEQYKFTVQATDHTENSGPNGTERFVEFFASRIEYPDGEVLTLSYQPYNPNSVQSTQRPWRISSSNGYHMDIQYISDDRNAVGWFNVKSAAIFKTSSPSTALAKLTYSTDGTQVSDLSGRTWLCSPNCGNGIGAPSTELAMKLQLPGSSVAHREALSSNGLTTTSLHEDGIDWTYAYTGIQKSLNGRVTYNTLSVAGPQNYKRTYEIDVRTDPPPNVPFLEAVIWNAGIKSFTDALGQRTEIVQDDRGRTKQITFPEKNGFSVTRDTLGNITEKRTFPKPNSGLATLVETAGYSTSSSSRILGWRPNWTVDARSNRTDYTWANHGGLLTRLDPVDGNGRRRKIKFEYDGLNRPSREEICATNSAGNELTCGTAGASVKLTTYWENTRLPLNETTTNGLNAEPLTTAFAYDPAGRLLSIDPPLAGTDDASYFRYDSLGRRTWEIGPKGADGYRQVIRTTYRDIDDKVIRTERGRIGSVNDATLTVFQQTDTEYSARRLPTVVKTSASGVAHKVTQTSYDEMNRPDCIATRMNSQLFNSLPASACTHQSAGIHGADRIIRNEYDKTGALVQIRKAVGTDQEQAYTTYSYTPNGKREFIIDANGNRAKLTWDGLDRQSRWYFPSPTAVVGYNPQSQAAALAAAGAVTTGDYEEYGYDANGNRTSLRKRDGRIFGFGFDAMNRMILKTVPDNCISGFTCFQAALSDTRDVYYGYDVRGLQTYARFDSVDGDGITNIYDMRGKLTSSATKVAGVTRLLGYDYDANGNRNLLRFPDGKEFSFYYDSAGRMTEIRESGGQQIANFVYNDRDERTNIGGGFQTGLTYDGLGRLASVSHDLSGQAQDVSYCLGSASQGACLASYNPANQVLQRTASNNVYAWDRHVDLDRSYGINGLNQYTTAGNSGFHVGFGYDANGNLASTVDRDAGGSNLPGTAVQYGYDAENRLVNVSGATSATLSWDPMGRLSQSTGTATTNYLYDGDELVGEYDAAGNLQRRYIHGGASDDPLIWYEGTGLSDRRHLRTDPHGSVVAISDRQGNSIGVNSYDEYGMPGKGNVGRFQYTGQAYLPELGLYHYKARVYSPTLGRFLQTDPIGYEDQINLYAYVNNDPINHKDPSGLQCVETDNGQDCTATAPPPPAAIVGIASAGTSTPLRQDQRPQRKSDNNVISSAKRIWCAVSALDLDIIPGISAEQINNAARGLAALSLPILNKEEVTGRRGTMRNARGELNPSGRTTSPLSVTSRRLFGRNAGRAIGRGGSYALPAAAIGIKAHTMIEGIDDAKQCLSE